MVETRSFDRGTLANGLPYVRLSGGPRILLYFPGLGDTLGDLTKAAAKLARSCGRWRQSHTVYMLTRRKPMPDGFTVADMVAEVALGVPEILAAEDGEHDRVDLLGASMGGFLALQLAADYPDLVRRVVLTASAHTVGPAGLALEDEWTVMVRERRWVALYLGIIRTCYVGFKREWLSLAVISAWPWLRRGPDAPEDGMRQVRACMRFDIGDRLGEIAAPVMLIGGASDRYFTPNLIAQTAELLAEAYVHIVAGASHAVAAQFAPEHDRIALAF